MKNKTSQPPIPDVDIIDLEAEEKTPDEIQEDFQEETEYEEADERKRKPFRINMHLILLFVFLIFVGGLVYKFFTWGERIDLSEIFKDGQGTYEDTYDEFLPLIDADGKAVPVDYSDGLTIVAFGNAPFADDRDSEKSLANLIAKDANATVYNCSITGSYVAAQSTVFSPEYKPMDIYTPYWMATLFTSTGQTREDMEDNFRYAAEHLGDDCPADATEVFDTLASIDFSTVDVITFMYDATDYLMGNNMYNFENTTDITYFANNLEAAIELIQNAFPNIHIIVLGPAYAYGLEDDGTYVSSDIKRYGNQDALSVYSIMEWNTCASRSVTFVDNLYGTITEDNAKQYLTDYIHLNQKGREKIAERFLYALNYFNSDNSTAQD